jgi:hypothetical protein
LYHGGEGSEPVALKVLEDLKKRRITFLSNKKLHIPIRSCVDGSLLKISDSGRSFAEVAIRSILIDSLNWQDTWENISSSGVDGRTISERAVEVHAFGPHSRSFFSRARTTPKVSVIDRSRDEIKADRNDPDESSIAVVGMAVNFPGASDKESLWRNLENGINTLQTASRPELCSLISF